MHSHQMFIYMSTICTVDKSGQTVEENPVDCKETN